jgi:perosamine synthetase
MKYKTALPYFSKEDIVEILRKYEKILSGEGLMSMGPNVQELENKFSNYVGTKYAVATTSCTAALEIALSSLGIKKNDEVIIPCQTFFATGSSVVRVGAKPVFCEVDSNFLIDFEDLKNKVSQKTRAVIIVHFAGLIHPEIVRIKSWLESREIILIEDAAHAHGATIDGSYAGNLGDIGCFSFYSTKIMATGEGGMLTTNIPEVFQKAASLRSRGLDISAGYEIFTNFGSNFRVSEFQAILGLYQLKRLEQFVDHRNKIADIFREILDPLKQKGIIEFQKYPANIRHSYWRFIVFLKKYGTDREYIQKRMGEKEIAIDWPYSPLLHQQPAFKQLLGHVEGDFPYSENLAKQHICLPIHLMIEKDDACYIAESLKYLLQ